MSSVQVNDGSGFGHACGAALVTRTLVVTAAHCVTAFDGFGRLPVVVDVAAPTIRVAVGQPVLGSRRIVTRRVSAIYVPRTFRRVLSGRRTWSYDDIALLRLARPVATRLVPYARAGHDPAVVGVRARVLGWGVDESGDAHRTLRQASVRIGSPRLLPPDARRLISTRRQVLVVEEPGRGTGVCHGDSGGPLLVEQRGRLVLAGVVGFGVVDCPGATPAAIFTRVAPYASWIARPGASAPFSLTLPRVVGVPRIGRTVRCDPGRFTAHSRLSGIDWYAQSEVGPYLVASGPRLHIERTIAGEPAAQLELRCAVRIRRTDTRALQGRATSRPVVIRG